MSWEPHSKWACRQAVGRVLDVGCGAGRHAAFLASRRVAVTGVDPSPGAVSVSRARGVDAHLGLIAQPPPGIGQFDTIMLMGGNLGLLGGRDQAPAVLAQLAALVRPGARLVGTSGVHPYGDETTNRKYEQWNEARGRMPGQLRVRIRDGDVATPWCDYLIMSADELAAIVTGSAWTLEHVEGGANYAALLRYVG